jgi:hypothetical protein
LANSVFKDFLTSSANDNFRTELDEALRKGLPEASATAGHENLFPFEDVVRKHDYFPCLAASKGSPLRFVGADLGWFPSRTPIGVVPVTMMFAVREERHWP